MTSRSTSSDVKPVAEMTTDDVAAIFKEIMEAELRLGAYEHFLEDVMRREAKIRQQQQDLAEAGLLTEETAAGFAELLVKTSAERHALLEQRRDDILLVPEQHAEHDAGIGLEFGSR